MSTAASAPPRGLEGGEHPPVQADLAAGRDRRGDRLTAQVVAEGDAPRATAHQPGAVEGAQRGQADRQRGQQVIGDRLRCCGQQVGDVPRLGVERHGAVEDRVAHRRRHVGAVVVEHLRDEERVAAGELLDAGGVDGPVADEVGDRRQAERPQR